MRHLTTPQHLWGRDGERSNRIFTVVPGRRHKLKLKRFRLEIRDKFFPTGTARQVS